MLNLKEWFDPVLKVVVALVIPAFIWVNASINDLKNDVALLQQQLSLRSADRDTQMLLIMKIIQDHEERLRQLERHP